MYLVGGGSDGGEDGGEHQWLRLSGGGGRGGGAACTGRTEVQGLGER